MELIGRKDAIKAVLGLENCYNGFSDTYDKSCIVGLLDELPSIDAVPVRRGRWIGGELGECSVCGHVGCASDIWTGCDDFYCPNCGAKMEVDDE